MKTIHAVILLSTALLFSIAGCSGSTTSRVTLDMSGKQALSSFDGVIKASSGSVIPSDISVITITVRENSQTGPVLAERRYTAKLAEAGISLDIPAGKARYFIASATTTATENAYTPATYRGVAGPYDLEADTDTDIPLSITRENAAVDAAISLTILNSEGKPFAAADYDAVVASSFETGVYLPVITTDAEGKKSFSLNEDVPVAKTATLGGTLTAYPGTFQILIVKAFASDDAVSFLGGAVVSTLVSGTGNSVTVTMYTPSRIKPTLNGYTRGEVVFKETVAGIDVTLGTYTSWTNGTEVNAYSGVTSSDKKIQVDRIINVYVDGLLRYTRPYSTSDPLIWKRTTVTWDLTPQ